jgi:hypothetical protein
MLYGKQGDYITISAPLPEKNEENTKLICPVQLLEKPAGMSPTG